MSNPDENDFLDNIEREIDIRNATRGEFLEKMAIVENTLNQIIAWHFCNTEAKQKEFEELIVRDNTSLERKINLLKSILENNYVDLLESETGLIEKLNGLRIFRNKLAHGIGVSDAEGDSNLSHFKLVVYRRGKLLIEKVTNEEIEQKQYDIVAVGHSLSRIQIRVLTGAPPPTDKSS